MSEVRSIQNDKLLVGRVTAARLLDISPRTIDTMLKDGRLNAVRIGRAVKISTEELRRYIARYMPQGVTNE